ncbi:MAG: 16S rRNA (adenine(1518)-N(6)/adenine(1519)-N(6))-dimethyltransferase RsmA [Clostridia bacterium]|nr:16S rRNA (adenine(1518)-N(6)/adenine(1519)-N(6))-dimethyltransferase RsmA [Clostridia bacterium]
MNLCDIKTVRQIMAMFNLSFRKEFGQNFLIERSVVQDIAWECCEDENSAILEIGPGIGTLTYELASCRREVVALEIDRGLIPVLSYTLGEFDNVKVINEDVMQTDLEALLAPYFEKGKVSVCANLPYYITTPILMKLLECGLPFDYITIMIQAEVADRLCAKAGSKDYGAITAVLAYYGVAEKLFKVPAGKFLPAPKVDSTVIRIRLHKEKPYRPLDEAILFRTVKAAFGQRRKTLANALGAGFSELSKEEIASAIAACGHEPTIRGERLDIAEFTALSDALCRILKTK